MRVTRLCRLSYTHLRPDSARNPTPRLPNLRVPLSYEVLLLTMGASY